MSPLRASLHPARGTAAEVWEMSSAVAGAEAGEVSELREFIDSDGCPELIRARVEALLKFLTERNIDASVDDYVSDDGGGRLPQLTLNLTLDFGWRSGN